MIRFDFGQWKKRFPFVEFPSSSSRLDRERLMQHSSLPLYSTSVSNNSDRAHGSDCHEQRTQPETVCIFGREEIMVTTSDWGAIRHLFVGKVSGHSVIKDDSCQTHRHTHTSARTRLVRGSGKVRYAQPRGIEA